MKSLPELGTIYAWTAPFSTPIPSAIFLAYHMYGQFEGPDSLAIAIGIGAFVGFEAAGGACMAAFMALKSKKGWDNFDLWIAALGILGYIVSPVFVLKFGYGPLIFAGLTSVGVYSGVAWFRLHTEEKEIEKHEQFEFEKGQLELKKLRAELRLQKATNFTNVQIDTNSDSKNTKLYICNYCQGKFDNPRKFAVHNRYCEKKP